MSDGRKMKLSNRMTLKKSRWVLRLSTYWQIVYGILTVDTKHCLSVFVRSQLSYLYSKATTNLSHKHKKRKGEKTFDAKKIEELSLSLLEMTEKVFIKNLQWKSICEIILELAVNLRKYAAYLEKQNENFKKNSQKKISFTFPKLAHLI